MRPGITFKVVSLLTVFAIVTCGVLFVTIQIAKRYVVYREFIDLADESSGYARVLIEDFRVMREEVSGLAARELEASVLIKSRYPDLDRRQALDEGRRYLRITALEITSPDAEISIDRDYNDSSLVIPAISQHVESELRSQAGRSASAVSAGGSYLELTTIHQRQKHVLRPVLWCWKRDSKTPTRYIVAALNLAPRFENLALSPRALTYLFDIQGKFFLHPQLDTASALNDVAFTIDNDPILDGVLRQGLEGMNQRLDTKGDVRIYRKGYLWPNKEQCSGRETAESSKPIWYQQSRVQRSSKLDDVLLREYKNPGLSSLGAMARTSSRITGGVGRIRIRAEDRGQLNVVRTRIEEVLGRHRDESGSPVFDRKWDKPVQCREFKVHLVPFGYRGTPTSDDPAQFVFAQAVATEEIRAEAASEMKFVYSYTIGVVLCFLGLGVILSFAITKPIERIAECARQFARPAQREQIVFQFEKLLPLRRRDQIGTLARDFRHMANEIQTSHDRLQEERDSLEERVKERTKELQKAKDVAVKANAEKDELLRTVSHELRKPLAHINGYTLILGKSQLDERQEKAVKVIHDAGEHLNGLISDILDYPKIKSGRLDLWIQEFELGELIQNLVEAERAGAEAKGLALNERCSDDLGVMRSDRRRVAQILINLLGNACKFTTDGHVRLVAERECKDGADWMRIAVSDTGAGMNPHQLSELFKPYVRILDRRQNPDGLGLGLAISRGLCQILGGDIDVQSEPGEGSVFTVSLPAEFAGEEALTDARVVTQLAIPGANQTKETPSTVSRASNTVLVIDDDPTICELMSELLRDRGFQAVTATSGEEGLKLANRLEPDAITLDILMPGTDGWGTLAALKNSSRTANIPVILVTMLEDQSRGFALGASDFMTKPIAPDRLAALLRKYIAESGQTILVVDNETTNRKETRRVLEQMGFSVMEAANGASGFEIMRDSTPTVILVELTPTTDAFAFVDQLRQAPHWRSIPVVAVTSENLSCDELRSLEGYVCKVVQRRALSRESLFDLIGDQIRKLVSRGA